MVLCVRGVVAAAVLLAATGVSGKVYSQYTLDGPTVTDSMGLTSVARTIPLGQGDDAVCGQSYHMQPKQFISLAASNGAPTGNVDFSVGGHVKRVSGGNRALFSIGGTFRDPDNTRGNWGAWVWVETDGRLGMRTLKLNKRSTTLLPVGQWTHIAMVYTASESKLRLHVNGTLASEVSVVMDLRRNSRYGGMAIGEYHLGGSPWGRGGEFFVDHVSFADHAATPDELRAPCDPISVAAVCKQKGAQCGAIRSSGYTVQCGGCGSGETCSSNRCEASCSLTQIGSGPFDTRLFAYLPLEFTYADLSPQAHAVDVQLLANDRSQLLYTHESRVDMTHKTFDVTFSRSVMASTVVLSFKTMPTSASQSALLLQAGKLAVVQQGTAIGVSVIDFPASTNTAQLNYRSCNHVSIALSETGVTITVNGYATQHQSLGAPATLLGAGFKMGQFTGKVWDVRVYEGELTADELRELAQDCGGAVQKTVPDAGYPNYLCGVYQCMYWPDGVTDTTLESFEYQLAGHDTTWEHNVMEAGMYKHGALCAEYAKPRLQLLNEGYRRSWVSKFNFANTWNQYVLHENYHSYQNRVGSGNGRFIAESTASWGAFAQKPTAYDTILGMYTLQPHLSMWAEVRTVFEQGIVDVGKGGHPYGAAIWLWYVTYHVLQDAFFVGRMYNRLPLGLAPTSGTPTEAMYTILGEAGFDMRVVFSRFAARITTWDVDYADTFLASEEGSYRRLLAANSRSDAPYPDDEVDNKIIVTHNATGTDGAWTDVPARYKVCDWAWNAYLVPVQNATAYTVSVRLAGDAAAHLELHAEVVVHNEASGVRTYHTLAAVTPGTSASVAVSAAAGEKLYLVVANTPSTQYTGSASYTYEYAIAAAAA